MNRKYLVKIAALFSGVTILVGVIIGLDFYFLKQGIGYKFILFGQPVLKLGMALNPPAAKLDTSFDVSTYNGETTRLPKFIRNVKVLSESEGVLTGADIHTGEQHYYSWSDDTHYICVPPSYAGVKVAPNVKPEVNLDNYTFVFKGDYLQGVP